MLCSAGTNYTITKGFLHVRNISIINNTYNVNQHVFLPMKTKYMLLHTHSAIYSKYSHILLMASYLKLIFFLISPVLACFLPYSPVKNRNYSIFKLVGFYQRFVYIAVNKSARWREVKIQSIIFLTILLEFIELYFHWVKNVKVILVIMRYFIVFL